MKVLAVDQYGVIGGGQQIFLQTMECLAQSGAAIEAAFPLGGGLEAAVRSRLGARVTCRNLSGPPLSAGRKTPMDAARLFTAALGLLPLVPELSHFDFVYVNGPRLFPFFLAAATVSTARFVYHVHLDHSTIEKQVVGALLRHPRTHAVIANSAFVAEGLRASLGRVARGPRLRVVENALDHSLSARPFVDRWVGAPDVAAAIVGQLIPEKGAEDILAIAPAFPGITFHFLGEGDPARPNFARSLRERAPANVVFHGRMDDVAGAIDSLGVQVNLVPSRRPESFGLSAIEGMACSCLTVTSGRGGLREIGDRTGAWTATTKEDWMGALHRIANEARPELAAMTHDQHDRTLHHYSFDRFADQMRAVFST